MAKVIRSSVFRVVRVAGLAVVTATATLVVGSVATRAPASAASTACPWVGSSAPISQRVSQLIGRMSTARRSSLLTGHPVAPATSG